MKIVYGGRCNKNSQESIRNSFIYTYQNVIKEAVGKGKKIAMVTLAQPDGYYNFLTKPLYQGIADVIDSKKQNIKWSEYDGIFIPGGYTVLLLQRLIKTNFQLNQLKKDAAILGDSAGAYILSSYFYLSPHGPKRGIEMEFKKGLNPTVKLITIAHKNNPRHCNDILIRKVNEFAKEKNLKTLALQENEQKLLKDDKFVDVKKELLFK